MIAAIRKQLAWVPFIPFSIRTSDGFIYAVPTVDYVCVTPNGRRVIVSDDDDSVAILTPLQIGAVVGRDIPA